MGIVGKSGCVSVPKYTRALIQLLQWFQYKLVNLIYGMIGFEVWQTSVAKNQRFFIKKKIFSLVYIIRGAYVISAIAVTVQYWLLNNYVD